MAGFEFSAWRGRGVETADGLSSGMNIGVDTAIILGGLIASIAGAYAAIFLGLRAARRAKTRRHA